MSDALAEQIERDPEVTAVIGRESPSVRSVVRTVLTSAFDTGLIVPADERDRFKEDSILLNSIGWKMAVALGDVPEGARQVHGDVADQLSRLIAQRDRLAEALRRFAARDCEGLLRRGHVCTREVIWEVCDVCEARAVLAECAGTPNNEDA